MAERTVPVVIDDRTGASSELLRCVYFYFRGDEPGALWTLGFNQQVEVPFILLEMAGIILQPIDGDLFESPDQVDSLFSLIEGTGLSVEIADLWIPTRAINMNPEELNRGVVLRLGERFFRSCLNYRYGEIDLEYFENQLKEFSDSLRVSERESKVFLEWSYLEVDLARERRNPELQLPRKITMK
jgi:hypothetical protein